MKKILLLLVLGGSVISASEIEPLKDKGSGGGSGNHGFFVEDCDDVSSVRVVVDAGDIGLVDAGDIVCGDDSSHQSPSDALAEYEALPGLTDDQIHAALDALDDQIQGMIDEGKLVGDPSSDYEE